MSGDGYYRINVQGVIQGVGFRPFVFLLARDLGLAGTVSNSSSGVNIRLRAAKHELDTFLDRLESGAPEPAVIESIGVFDARPFEADDFEIVASSREGERSVLISPDLATCADCFKELLDESDRRFRYPFINCTNCGPRFTIIADTPYDRPCTSMAEFEMCEECQREYDDPSDRRFHAQPNACPRCGPRLWLADRNGDPVDGDPIAVAADLLRDGRILALKGLGGFHLACDATSDEAVACLRERKMRYAKPLAVMVKDLEEAARYCEVSEKERQILQSPRCPIVLLEEKEGSPISGRVAPNLTHQGLLLPYTPVHHLLVRETGLPLVMTSGNISSEPISVDNREALLKLSGIADYFLLHDRDILVRYDDSVVRVMDESESPIRRARGYSPYPVRVRPAAVEVLGVGAEYKNTFCLLRGEHAFIGQHIGDLETREEMRHYEQALAAMKRLFSLQPQLVAYDLHPEYMSTQMAMDMPLEKVGIQHHHAHVASCMADNSLDERVIGVAWDGTGYGADGTVWGGEFLLCDMGDYQRVAHLYQHPMPGGDACIHDIYRMAAGALFGIFEDAGKALSLIEELVGIRERDALAISTQLQSGVNCPLTSSAGRMFDAVACLAGIRTVARYDGQAACELEASAVSVDGRYGYDVDRSATPLVVDTRPLVEGALADILAKQSPTVVAGKFHATLADVIVETCGELSRNASVGKVVLSGGVFQNEMLTTMAMDGLRSRGLEVFVHRRVPCNDGGISLGQAMVAARRFERGLAGSEKQSRMLAT